MELNLKKCQYCGNLPGITVDGFVFCDHDTEILYTPDQWNARQDAAPQPAPAPDLTEAKLAALENIAANTARIATALEILCDLLADAMTETDNLTEQDEPTALHMGGNVLSNGVFTPWPGASWQKPGAL